MTRLLPDPFGILDYTIDATQRSILFWDTLRQLSLIHI